MANKDIEKISVVFNGIGTRDADLATKHVNVKKYTQHNPQAAEGVKGLRESISQLPEDSRPVTVVRFDAAYFGLFKCNLRRIADYPHLSGYLRDL